MAWLGFWNDGDSVMFYPGTLSASVSACDLPERLDSLRPGLNQVGEGLRNRVDVQLCERSESGKSVFFQRLFVDLQWMFLNLGCPGCSRNAALLTPSSASPTQTKGKRALDHRIKDLS